MKHIYDKHQLVKHMTIDDLLIDDTHRDYRDWLKQNRLPMYPMTRGLYEEALFSDDPKHEYHLSAGEAHRVLYSAAWTEPRKCKTDDIKRLLMSDSTLSQEYIAIMLGVTQARVSQVARKYSLRPERKKRKDVTPEEVRELRDLPAQEIARKLNISLSTVYKKICKSI
jgi:DNA-binding transcriptional regulator YiaG